MKEILPKMAKSKYGKIVFVLSSATVNIPPKYMADYIAVKYALLGLMKSLAQEYAGGGLNINGVSPSMMETKFLAAMPGIIVEKARSAAPRGRNANTADTAASIRFLLSDAAEYITGQNLAVSGGNII
jgi:3-oxoacyl-[acyl-carrier protein] reductase